LPPDHDEELRQRLARLLWRQRQWEEAARGLEETQPIPPEEAIARHDRMAVLGEAGADKSTLLRHLAWERTGALEASLPLLVPLGAGAGSGGPRELGRARPEVLAGLRALAEESGTWESVRRAAREALERLEG
jgi:hypothetical protein